MKGLNQKEIKVFLNLLQQMNLQQLQKLKEIISGLEESRIKLESILNDFDELFKSD